MSSVVISGDTSGSITLSAPAVSGSNTVTLPAATGSISLLTQGTAVSATGNSVEFTGIPSWAKRITLVGANVSSNGTSGFLVQMGDSGGIEISGYVGGGAVSGIGVITNSIGFQIFPAMTAATNYQFKVVLFLLNSATNLWVADSSLSAPNVTGTTNGSKTLSDVLTQVRLTTVNGTDTFDAGTINIMYEG